MEYIDILRAEKDLIELISFESKYPGNIKSNIAIYNVIKEKYGIKIDKKVFMALCMLYLKDGNIDRAYCKVCGKICNVKSDYSFREACSKECGVKLASETRSRIYSSKSEDEKEVIKNKRRQTNLEKYGTTTNLQNKALVESRMAKYGGNSPFASAEVRENIAKSNIEKYGSANSFQWDSTKDKIRETKLERYGDSNYNNSVQMKNTQEEKYGGIGWSSEIINSKIKETNLERYGVEYHQQSKVIKERIRKSNQERYGVDAPMQNKEIQQKSIETCIKKYNVPYNCMSEQCRTQAGAISKINLEWKDRFEQLGYEVILEKSIGHMGYDLYLPERNLFIEINPNISHQSTQEFYTYFGKIRPRDKDYHKNKFKIAKDNGYNCMMIWEWDDSNEILKYFKKYDYNINKCTVETFVEEANIYFVCKYKNEVLGELYINKYSENDYVINNFNYVNLEIAKMLYTYFLKAYHVINVTYVCDLSKINENDLIVMNFKLKEYKDHIPHLVLINNIEVEVYDCGQAAYVWHEGE